MDKKFKVPIQVFEITTRSLLEGLVWLESTNTDFQQNRILRSFPFSFIYHKTAGRYLPEPKKFHSAPMSGLPDEFWS
ncbi:hypothetical protein TNCV_1048771 [Trichonephila clavipes]|nr:hypothetical protein TNCV_1048771 [Trichonephila clavipes]